MKIQRRPILAVVLLGALYWGVAVSGPLAVGAWQDDAIYIATAKSLAAGEGYRHAEIPGEPLQAKYPVLYPAVLAAILKIAPQYPENVPLLLLPTAIAAAALIVMSAVYWRRVLGVEPRSVAALAVLAAFAPGILSMIRFTMSDLLYAAFAMGAILLLDGSEDEVAGDARDSSSVPKRAASSISVGTAALLLGASALTRSIGLTAIGGAIAFLLWRRRFRDAVLVLGISTLCVSPWHLWAAWAARANDAAFQGSPLGTLLLSELNYAVWAPQGSGEILRVMWQNVFHLAFGFPYFQLGLPESIGARALATWSWWTAGLHAMGYALLVAVAVGFGSSARRRPRALHFCALPYALVVLAYPGDPYRFLLPWAPFLLFFLFQGIERIVAVFPRSSEGWGRRAKVAAFALLCLAFAWEAARIVASDADDYYFRVTPQSPRDARDLEAAVLELTDPDDIIASGDFATLYLATGRQGFFAWPIVDPYALFYGDGRRWWNFYIRGGEAETRFVLAQVRDSLAQAYAAGGVKWYVDNARPDFLTGAVRTFIAEHRPWFTPRYLTPGGMFRIYRVELPTRATRNREESRFR